MIDLSALSNRELYRLNQLEAAIGNFALLPADIGLSDKQLHHWARENILFEAVVPDEQPAFNFVESLWILLALELRSYGFSLNELRTIRGYMLESDINWLIDSYDNGLLTDEFISQLEGTTEGRNISLRAWIDEGGLELSRQLRDERPIEISNLYGHVLLSLLRETPYTFAFNHNGLMHLDWDYDFGHLKNKHPHGEFKSSPDILIHIISTGGLILSLDHLISRLILIEPKYSIGNHPINLLISPNELEIIQQLRKQRDCLTVRIDFKDKDPVMFHFKTELKNINNLAQLTTLLRKHAYEDIEIKSENGRIVYATKVTHVKAVNKLKH